MWFKSLAEFFKFWCSIFSQVQERVAWALGSLVVDHTRCGIVHFFAQELVVCRCFVVNIDFNAQQRFWNPTFCYLNVFIWIAREQSVHIIIGFWLNTEIFFPYYYMANPVLGKSLCSDWFFLGQDFAVRTVPMETVQSVYFCF